MTISPVTADPRCGSAGRGCVGRSRARPHWRSPGSRRCRAALRLWSCFRSERGKLIQINSIPLRPGSNSSRVARADAEQSPNALCSRGKERLFVLRVGASTDADTDKSHVRLDQFEIRRVDPRRAIALAAPGTCERGRRRRGGAGARAERRSGKRRGRRRHVVRGQYRRGSRVVRAVAGRERIKTEVPQGAPWVCHPMRRVVPCGGKLRRLPSH